MTEVTRYTKDYLVYLREKVGAIIEEGGSMQDAYNIDQSAYAHYQRLRFLPSVMQDRFFK
jgi:hypothetical protein